ncbi:MAG: hypothetical protein HFF84_06095 [Oscillibacter sp.]|nr:hypothetical protein [Oscillibacter sp.]
MVDLNAPVWGTLSAAGNDADKWLRRLLEEPDNFRDNMDILAEDLSHQLSYYSATAYVLPYLAALCPKLSTEDKVYLIAQMGAAIAAEAEQPLEPGSEAYREFQEGLEGLRRETEPLVTGPAAAALLPGSGELGQMFALGALAILGDRQHARQLYYASGSCWEEAPAACSCGWNDETLPLSEELDCAEPASIKDWDGKSLTEEAVWFQGLLSLAEDEMITPTLPILYGTGVCPECGKRESFWAWMERF